MERQSQRRTQQHNKREKVELKDTQDDLECDDANNNRESREYTADRNQMGCSETDVKKGLSGKNDEEQLDSSVD
jgi:hypothetical protein